MLMTSAYFHGQLTQRQKQNKKIKQKPQYPHISRGTSHKRMGSRSSHPTAKCAKVGGILGKPNGPMKGFPFSIKGVLHPERRRLQSIPANVSFSKSKVHFFLLFPIAWTTHFSLFISEEVLVLFSQIKPPPHTRNGSPLKTAFFLLFCSVKEQRSTQ